MRASVSEALHETIGKGCNVGWSSEHDCLFEFGSEF